MLSGISGKTTDAERPQAVAVFGRDSPAPDAAGRPEKMEARRAGSAVIMVSPTYE